MKCNIFNPLECHSDILYILALAILRSGGKSLRRFLSDFISWSGIFHPRLIYNAHNAQSSLALKHECRMEATIRELLNTKILHTDKVQNILQNLDDASASINYELIQKLG
jgi:hypothetical protein